MNKAVFNALSLMFVIPFTVKCAMAESLFTKKLEDYGRQVAATGKPGVFKYVGTKQTMSTPLVAYVVKFKTDDASFRSRDDAATNNEAYAINTGRRLVWETRFCTRQLREMMREKGVNIVNGNLTNNAGETQFIAGCMLN